MKRGIIFLMFIFGMPCLVPKSLIAGCISGGEGSSECSISIDTKAGGTTYSVKCFAGYYACCDVNIGGNSARCVKNKRTLSE